jgi:hypothetical protein
VALTDSSVVVTQAIFDLLLAAKKDLGLAAVHYGDTDLYPKFPVALVESGPKSRPLTSASARRFVVGLTTFITIVHGKVEKVDTTKKRTEEFAELIEAKLHEDFTLGDLVIFGHVTSMDPGVIVKPSVMVRASRLTWTGTSRKTF